MKISMVIPVYKQAKQLGRFLEDIKEQTKKPHDLIFVVDTNVDNTLSVIEKYRKVFENEIKIVYNSKRTSRSEAIFQGANLAKGDYSLVISLGNAFNHDLIKDISALAKDKDSDIIEFRAKMSSPIRSDGKIRKTFNKKVNLKENDDAFAFSHPLDFNKVFRTSILKEASRFKLPVRINSRFSIDVNYLAFIVAETYSTTNKVFVTSKSKIDTSYNPLKIIRQFESLNKFFSDYTHQETSHRFTYAQYFAEAVYMSALVKASKNKVLIRKFNEKFTKQKETTFYNFFETNRFALKKNNEIEILKKHVTTASLPKLHKEIG